MWLYAEEFFEIAKSDWRIRLKPKVTVVMSWCLVATLPGHKQQPQALNIACCTATQRIPLQHIVT